MEEPPFYSPDEDGPVSALSRKIKAIRTEIYAAC